LRRCTTGGCLAGFFAATSFRFVSTLIGDSFLLLNERLLSYGRSPEKVDRK
jgi:hypothetical protein